jgi:threonine dehydrogenase-like Zn-dependent dehydrogenase
MKAIAVFPKTREVKLVDHPEPRIGRPTDVKIKILHIGVCGTDREIWDFKYGTPPPDSEYLITGHESFGQVVETGPSVTTVKAGDLVVPTVRRGCPENCIACAQMRQDFCYTGHFTERGIKGAHGYMAEYVVDDEKYMNRVPPELRDYAVLLEPLTIAEKALMQVYTIQSRLPWECRLEQGGANQTCHNAMVLGAGPVGLLGAMALRLLNMDVHIVARDAGPNTKTTFADSIGAVYHATSQETPLQIAGRMGNVDLIFEATGAAKASFDFMQILGTNGIFIFTGVPAPMNDITLDAGALMRDIVLNNQVVLGTVNAPKLAFENGIRDLAEFQRKWPQALSSLITGYLPLERFAETVKRTNREEIKTVLTLEPVAALKI